MQSLRSCSVTLLFEDRIAYTKIALVHDNVEPGNKILRTCSAEEAQRFITFKQIVSNGSKPGIIAYLGNEPVGWCAVAPRHDYVALERSRILKPVDNQPVWSVSCLFVRKDSRRQGVAAKLLSAAVEFAKRRGAKIVEGYPVEPSNDNMPDPFLWHGVPSAFKAAGFKEVLRRSKSRPIMRYVMTNQER